MTMATPFQTLDQMINGFRLTPVLGVVAKLGIADWLQERPRTSAELARLCGVNCVVLYRVLSALCSVGVLSQRDTGEFELTPVSEPLCTNSPNSLRATAMTWAEPGNWRAFGGLMHSVKTGETAFDHVFGMGIFDYYANTPEEAAVFHSYMTERTARILPNILATLDLTGVRTVVDIGGGQGLLLAALLEVEPNLRAVLFDHESVLPEARERLTRAGFASRCRFEAGDFFSSDVPSEGDLYILKWVLHDWTDEESLTVLCNCRRNMRQSARLVLIEQVVRPDNPESYRTDIAMMLLTGGRERTEDEYRSLLAASGFEFRQAKPTGTAFYLIEAEPAG
jgi:ubiquinone/menaquinone biosynthesis C-methylase UbiE